MPVELRLSQSLPVMVDSACWPWPATRWPRVMTGTDVPEPGHHERHQQHRRGERVEGRIAVTALGPAKPSDETGQTAAPDQEAA